MDQLHCSTTVYCVIGVYVLAFLCIILSFYRMAEIKPIAPTRTSSADGMRSDSKYFLLSHRLRIELSVMKLSHVNDRIICWHRLDALNNSRSSIWPSCELSCLVLNVLPGSFLMNSVISLKPWLIILSMILS
jgi:hypothetical protein